MQDLIAALRTLVLPYGTTSGRRIVLDGVNGRIEIYNASDFLVASLADDGLYVYDADGSYVHVYDDTGGSGAVIDMQSANQAGHTRTPGKIRTLLDGSVVPTRPSLQLVSPSYDGGSTCSLKMTSGGPGSFLLAAATAMQFQVTSDFTIIGPAFYRGKILGNASANTNQAGPPVTETTTTATFGNVGDAAGAFAVAANIIKNDASTRLKCTFMTSCYRTGAVVAVRWRLIEPVSGVNATVTQKNFFSLASESLFMGGTVYLSGIPAGSVNIVPQWQRLSGTGTLNRDANDWISLCVEEVQN